MQLGFEFCLGKEPHEQSDLPLVLVVRPVENFKNRLMAKVRIFGWFEAQHKTCPITCAC